MATGISNMLNIGKSALTASQTCLQVTGNNIANVDTEGYSRQTVVLKDDLYVQTVPGSIGTGVVAQDVVRAHDAFIEAQYLQKLTSRDRFQELYGNLTTVQSLFNESNTSGVNSALSKYFADWGDLTTSPDSTATRQTMLDDTTTLFSLFRSMSNSMEQQRNEVEKAITQDVDQVNSLAKEIADINSQINQTQIDGQSIPNGLYDQRDQKVRALAALIDVNVIDNGKGNVTVNTNAGQTVVDGVNAYEFAFVPGRTVRQLSAASIAANSDAQAYFEGSDSSEYTLEVVSAGQVGVTTPTFRVSLDGGKTWLKDANGNDITYNADDSGSKVHVQNLDIWFGTTTDPNSTTNATLDVGDKFTLVPKKGLYWVRPTGVTDKSRTDTDDLCWVNVTPQQFSNGTDNPSRLTGGSLAGAFQFRDAALGEYQNTLDAMANSMVWEVNRIHSQGSGLTAFSSVQGTYAVANNAVASTPLGSPASGLVFGNRLTSGAVMLYAYDSSGTCYKDSITVDPTTDSLQDIVDKINLAPNISPYVTASVVNDKLAISGNGANTFRFGDDTSGLFAALGVNTLFDGNKAGNIAVNTVVSSNPDNVCSGHVGLNGLLATGDNTTALSMVALQSKDVNFYVSGKGTDSQTLGEYYSTMVSNVGSDTSSASYQKTYQDTLATQLKEQQQSASGVSLDEELTNMIKFQHSYQAAAKLISTADSLFQTILGLKN